MTPMLPIALDAMGGDKAPWAVVKGASIARRKHHDLSFIFYGPESRLAPMIARDRHLRHCSTIVHTAEVVEAHERPSVILRQNKPTSMKLAIEAVKEGKASAVVSSGNTGAFMAMSKLVLRTLPGVSRPAIVGNLPTNAKSDVIMLDLGANVACAARDLYQFAIMGDAFARTVLGASKPRIGLLNIGSEDIKGHEELQQAAQMIREVPQLDFRGFVEGDDILTGDYDLIVADGFTGNVALKVVEGTTVFFFYQLKQAMKKSFWGRLSFWLAKPALFGFKKRVDPRRYNGAMFLGLNGIAIKSHGGADAYAFSHAIREAYRLIKGDINARVIQEIAQYNQSAAGNPDAAAAHVKA